MCLSRMANSPRKCGGAISAANTGTTDALHPIPNPSSTRVSANCHVSCVADPKMAAMITDTAETIIAPRRPKRSSLIRTSENKQKLQKRQHPSRYPIHVSHYLHASGQIRSRVDCGECPDTFGRGHTCGDSVRSIRSFSDCTTIEFERRRPAEICAISRCLGPSLDSGSDKQHQIRCFERPWLLPEGQASLVCDGVDLLCCQLLIFVDEDVFTVAVLFVLVIWSHSAKGMLSPKDSCCLGVVSNGSSIRVGSPTLTKTASVPLKPYSHARRFATFLASSSSHLAKGLSCLLTSVRLL